MIVCVCRAVSDRVIRATIHAGATTVSEVSRACRAGSCCGACRPAIGQLIKEICPRSTSGEAGDPPAAADPTGIAA